MSLREIFMRPGSPPRAALPVPPLHEEGEVVSRVHGEGCGELGEVAAHAVDADHADTAPVAAPVAGADRVCPPAPAPSMPVDPPPVPTPRTPGFEAAPATTTSVSLSGRLPKDRTPSSPENFGDGAAILVSPTPTREDPPEVVALRKNRHRLNAELEAKRAALPGLADAVQTARTLARERSIEAVITPSPETQQAVREAQARLARAAEAETLATQELDTLRAAHDRASKALEQAAAAAQHADDQRVRAVVCSAEASARAKLALRDALDWLHLASRLKGAGVAAAGPLVAAALGLDLSGENMWRRSVELYERVLSEAKAAEAGEGEP